MVSLPRPGTPAGVRAVPGPEPESAGTSAGNRPAPAPVRARRPASSAGGLGELVAAARSGDRAAFEALVVRTYADTYALAHRLVGDAHDAADVTQEVYLRAYRALAGFRGDAEFTTWLYRITANCAATHLGRRRRHRHRPLPEHDTMADPDEAVDPCARAEATSMRERLDAAIDGLPPRLRAVVVLRDVYGLSNGDIAEALGISVTAAKVRLHRARRRLHDALFAAPE